MATGQAKGPRAASRTATLPTQAHIIEYFADAGPCDGLGDSIRPTDTWHLDDHPVKAGLIEPLDHACRAHWDLDVTACSDTDRLSRQLTERLPIEDHLACHGIRVLTPDDPAIATLGTVPLTPRSGAAPPSLSDCQGPGAADDRGGAW